MENTVNKIPGRFIYLPGINNFIKYFDVHIWDWETFPCGSENCPAAFGGGKPKVLIGAGGRDRLLMVVQESSGTG
jgi:hypothetical protein